MSVEMLKY